MRIRYLDVLRTAAVLAVILQHQANRGLHAFAAGSALWWWSVAVVAPCKVAVPVLFMISGALLLGQTAGRDNDWRAFFVRRFVKVLVPYLFWLNVYYVVGCLSAGDPVFDPGQYAREMIKGAGTAHIPSHLWFMRVLIGVYLAVPVLARFFGHGRRGEIGIFFACCLALGVLAPTAQALLGFAGDLNALIYTTPVMYFALGFVLHEARERRIALPALLFGAGAVMAAAGTGLVSLAQGRFSNALFHESSPFVLAMAAGAFLLVRRSVSARPDGPVSRGLASLAPASFGAYLVHVLWLRALPDWTGHAAAPAVLAVLFPAAAALSFASALLLRRIPVVRRLVP